MFCSIPTQRRQVLAGLANSDLVLVGDDYEIVIRAEKNTWTKVRRRQAGQGRTVPVPSRLTRAITFWKDHGRALYARLFGVRLAANPHFIISRSTTASFGRFSQRFTKVSIALSTLPLTPLAVRKLRATFYTRAVFRSSRTPAEREDAINAYADAIGNTAQTLMKSYVLTDSRERAGAVRRLVREANEMLGLRVDQ
jgi:hypothetical protein